jgi:RNA polymerase sigma-70 factor, ECF subfamily
MPRQHNHHQQSRAQPENISPANNRPPTPLHHGNGAPMPGKAPTKEAGQTDADVPLGRPSANWSDAQLLLHFLRAAGDQSGFTLFYSRCNDALITSITSIVDDETLAADIASEAWQRFCLCLRCGTVELDRNPKALIFTIARNKALDALRRQRRCPVFVTEIEEIADESRDPPRRQLPEDFWSKLPKWLPPGQCRAVVLIYRQELSVPQVGHCLGVTPGCIKRYLHMAIGKLKRQLVVKEIGED